MADNESKKLFGVDVPSNLEPIVIVLDNSDDDGKVRFRHDDIKGEILDKLGDHVAEITRAAGNDPKLKIGSEQIETRTALGNPATISDTSGAETTFKDTFESPESRKAIANFEQSSNSKLLPITIRKGKTDGKSFPSGMELLEEVNDQGSASTIAQAIRSVALENNRYACEDEYINPNERATEEDSNVGHVVLQEHLGKHTPRTWPELAGSGKEIKFEVGKLKNLGIQTLLEASGEYFVPDDTADFASVVAAKAASSAPGLARLGVRIPVSRFSAATIAQQVDPDFRKDSRFPELDSEDRYSYGNVNNPLVPFAAVSSTSAGIAAVLLTITISELVKALASVLGPPDFNIDVPDPMGSIFGVDDQSSAAQADQRKKRLGSYLGKDKDPKHAGSSFPVPNALGLFTGNFFLLSPTQEPYAKAVARGSEIFFGQVNNGVLGLVGAAFGIGDSFKHVSENPGYYNVLLRMLIRSTVESVGDVTNSVVGLHASILGETNPVAGTVLGKSALDIDRDIGLESDPTNLANVLNSVRESKMFKFMEVLAQLGDISLMTENTSQLDPSDIFESSIDAVRDNIKDKSFPNPAALVKKNRLSSNVGGGFEDHLAWGSNTLRSMYLLPSSLALAETKFKGTNNIYKNFGDNVNFKRGSIELKNRISQDDVKAIEQELDAYYVPFYFHDLRTNDIISFHSFIENITDTHDAEYTESDGYGRIGKVYTYKNTNRSIACSFKVVATNRTDFSEMWYKINRLVLMLYPQYTAGRPVSFVGKDNIEKKFIQPFSQLISSSPMIRLRLGDLIKSNFSDIDLARMFGVGTEQFNLTADNSPAGTASRQKQKISETVEGIKKKNLSGDFEENDVFWYIQQPSAGSRKPKTRTIKNKSNNRAPKVPSRAQYVVVDTLGPKKYEVKLLTPVEGVGELVVNFNETSSLSGIEVDDISVLQKAETQVGPADTPTANDPEDALRKTEEFFDEDSNPIVKSFASVAGQGLAGFIKRLSFDWSDARWDTEGLNNRAPMWMKIDIEFAPVNDINPGIDSSGAPIGMPYNIGAMLKLLKARRSDDSSLSEGEAAYAAAKALAQTPSNSSTEDQLSLSDPQAAISEAKFNL